MTNVAVAVGIIYDEDGSIFVTQRNENSHLAGFWEFPGGKIEFTESPLETLKREILEEIDINIIEAKFLKKIIHNYPDRQLTLYFYLITEWDGEPFAAEGQNSRWINASNLNADEFPEANRAIIEYLKEL